MGKRFSVTVGAVVLAAVAGCSSQAGSSGVVQDDVVASAASSMASPAASAMPSGDGAAVASPSTAASTASSAVASPAASPSALTAFKVATATNNDVCDTGLAYACGDTGESGVGIVFYASATPFACGPNLASTCNFLEVAPNLWNPNSASNCPGKNCGGSTQRTSDVSGTGKGITMCLSYPPNPEPAASAVGAGYANTTAWAVCKPYDAPNVARAYQGGGMTDWSLPSLNELTALYYYPNRNDIGGFVASVYWSSTGYSDSGGVVDVDVVGFNGGWQGYDISNQTWAVRPVRAF